MAGRQVDRSVLSRSIVACLFGCVVLDVTWAPAQAGFELG